MYWVTYKAFKNQSQMSLFANLEGALYFISDTTLRGVTGVEPSWDFRGNKYYFMSLMLELF